MMRRSSPLRGAKLRANPRVRSRFLTFETLEDRTTPTANNASFLASLGFSEKDLPSSDYGTMNWQSQETLVRTGEWIAQFHVSANAITPTQQIEEIREWLADLGDQVSVTRHLGADGLVLLKTSASITVETLAASLAPISALAYFEPNFVLWGTSTLPNDPQFGTQWWLDNPSTDVDIDAPEAWDAVTGSGSVVVGVIDTGVNYLHPDLVSNIWVNPGEIAGDGIDNDLNGYVDDVFGYDFANNDNNPMDDDGHGTSVAGIIAASGNNGLGVSGVNWNAKIMVLKYLNANRVGNTADATEAVNYATMMREKYGVNVRVLNNSYAIAGDSQAFRDAIAASGEAGILFVASAGNNSSNNDFGAVFPANIPLPNILSVAATTSSDVLADFSNYGPNSVHLAAPGANVYTTSLNGGYRSFNGTSAAAPVVAGVAALLWQAAPYASLEQIRDAILQGVDHLESLEGMLITEGRVNVANSLTLLGLRVLQVTPDLGAVVTTPPLDYTIQLSAAYDASSVDASDLSVNGITADSFTLVDERTITFHFLNSPVTREGLQTIHMATGALTRSADGADLLGLCTTFRFDSLILAVTAAQPAQGSQTAAPASLIRLEFNEDVDLGSVGINNLWLSQGSIVGFHVVDARTIEYLVTGVDQEGTVTYSLPAGILRDANGNGNAAFAGEFLLDIQEITANEFARVEPLGSLIFASLENQGKIQWSEDEDIFLVSLTAGESLAAVASATDPGTSITVELMESGASAAGAVATLTGIKINVTGQYKLRVTASAPTTYTLDIYKNVVLESEASDPAIPLDPSRLEIGSGRYGVIGSIVTEPGGTGANQPIYTANMSTNPGWTFTGGWAYGNPTGFNGDPVGGHTGSSVVGYVINGRYPHNITTTYYATTKAINTQGYENVTLSFRRRLGIESSTYDHANIQVSNDGVLWTTVWEHNGPTINETIWSLQSYDISAVANNQSTVYIRWGLGPTDNTVNYGGWNIDDVVVSGRPYAPDIDLYTIDLTGRAGTTLDIGLKGLGGVSQSNAVIELLGPDGTTILATSGVAPSTNWDQALVGVGIPADGIYTLRITSRVNGRYSLVVTEGTSLEMEGNDSSPSTATSFAHTWSLLGHIGQPPVSGLYNFVIDSNLTRITLSGNVYTTDGFINSPLTPQANGSLRANIEGFV
ncbi:MAG: S8 family peptidase, partial [Planctomycetota bacterium]